MVLLAAHLFRHSDQRFQRQVAARTRFGPVPVPSGCAIQAELSLRHGLLERFERVAHARHELLSGHRAKLRLRVMQVVDVEACEAQIG